MVFKTFALFMLAAGLAAAQTTYTLAPGYYGADGAFHGTNCPQLQTLGSGVPNDACTFPNLTGSDGSTGNYLAIGYPAPQLIYGDGDEGSDGPDAQYCDTSTWKASQTTIAILPNGQQRVLFVRDCDSNSLGVDGYFTAHLHWEVTGDSFIAQSCGRHGCTQPRTWWHVLSMFVTRTGGE